MRTLLGVIRKPDRSHGIINYLVELSKDLGTNLHLLYVENPANHVLGAPNLTGVAVANLQRSLELRIEEGKKTLKDIVGQMMSRIAGKKMVEFSAAIGDEVSIAGEMIASGKVQMLAIENRESNGLWWQDTMIREMVRNIDCPVWVIPGNAEYFSFRRIIYATDYQKEDIPTLQKLINLMHQLSPQILVLHITGNVDFEERVKTTGFQKMLESRTAYNNISAKVLAEKKGDNLVQLVNSYAAMNNADLIVVLKENKNFLERIFHPSSSERIMKAANTPVLVYHTGQ
jgi:nucleotide-binding universal stress UspA family protein